MQRRAGELGLPVAPGDVGDWSFAEIEIALDAAQARDDRRTEITMICTVGVMRALGSKVELDEMLGASHLQRRHEREELDAERERRRLMRAADAGKPLTR